MKSKERLEWEVDRSTPQKRVEDFVKRSEAMVHEMRHNERISAVPMFHLLSQNAYYIHLAMFVLSIVINLLILVYTYPDDESIEGAGYWNVQVLSRATALA